MRDQLGGVVSLDWHEVGLACEVAVPLMRRSASDQEPEAHAGGKREPTF